MRNLLVFSIFLLIVGSTFGQSFKQDGVISVHTMTITPMQDISTDQYLTYMEEKIIPEYEKIFHCKLHITEGLNREIEGKYGLVFFYKSKKIFNEYWKDDGSATEKGNEGLEKLQTLLDELQQLGTLTTTVNDWVIK